MSSQADRPLRFYGDPPAGWGEGGFPGRLIVFEGPDGAGRSTHIRLVKEWLEDHGLASIDTGLTRSELAGTGLDRAKSGHRLDPVTLNLFYATDVCDRLERVIIPSLRAGMVVLADRYICSLMARAGVRGIPREWMEGVYGFAPVPDKTIYLYVDLEHLLPRILQSGGFDYWESGQDFLKGNDPHAAYLQYQTEILEQFRQLAQIHDFAVVDARGPIAQTFEAIKMEVRDAVADIAGTTDGQLLEA